MPSSVTIPAGAASVQFDVMPQEDGADDGPQTVQITVSASGYESAAAELVVSVNAFPWQNHSDRFDVDSDGLPTPQDVLRIINDLNRNGSRLLRLDSAGFPPPFLDVNGDGFVTPADVLQVINFLNSQVDSEAEGSRVVDVASPSVEPAGSLARQVVFADELEWFFADDGARQGADDQDLVLEYPSSGGFEDDVQQYRRRYVESRRNSYRRTSREQAVRQDAGLLAGLEDGWCNFLSVKARGTGGQERPSWS